MGPAAGAQSIDQPPVIPLNQPQLVMNSRSRGGSTAIEPGQFLAKCARSPGSPWAQLASPTFPSERGSVARPIAGRCLHFARMYGGCGALGDSMLAAHSVGPRSSRCDVSLGLTSFAKLRAQPSD